MRPKIGSPLLILSPEDDSCRLYNPNEDRVYVTKSDLSEYRFLGSSGKWFLVLDSRADLYIIDIFSEEKILLPSLESIKGGRIKIEPLGDKEFSDYLITDTSFCVRRSAEKLRGLLCVDDDDDDFVWHFQNGDYLAFCKKGDDHYREISTETNVRRELRGQKHMLLKGNNLYVLAKRMYIRQLDFSEQEDGFKDVSVNHTLSMWMAAPSRNEIESTRFNKLISADEHIAVSTSGEVLVVYNIVYESSTTFERLRKFHLFKRDPRDLDPDTKLTELIEVDSLGDEALFFDLGITVPADHSLGIEPNSIDFTRDDRCIRKERSFLDICVYNLATRTIKRFPALSNFKLKDAQWFLSS